MDLKSQLNPPKHFNQGDLIALLFFALSYLFPLVFSFQDPFSLPPVLSLSLLHSLRLLGLILCFPRKILAFLRSLWNNPPFLGIVLGTLSGFILAGSIRLLTNVSSLEATANRSAFMVVPLLLAALGEEWFFRGILNPNTQEYNLSRGDPMQDPNDRTNPDQEENASPLSAKWPPIVRGLFSSILFSLAHGLTNLGLLVWSFVCGFLFWVLQRAFKNVWAAVAAHISYNLFLLLFI